MLKDGHEDRRKDWWRVRRLVVALTLAGLAVGFSSRKEAVGATGETGKAIMERQCLSCHEADLIVSQRLSRTGWTREVEKMVRWGAVVAEKDREPLIDYLTASYGPRRPAAAGAAAKNSAGEAIFNNQCLSCHEADLTRQQRLSRAGWTREVEKMVRWGAVVAEKDKEPLIDYLTAAFGPSVAR